MESLAQALPEPEQLESVLVQLARRVLEPERVLVPVLELVLVPELLAPKLRA